MTAQERAGEHHVLPRDSDSWKNAGSDEERKEKPGDESWKWDDHGEGGREQERLGEMHFANRRVYITRVERAATGAKCGSAREDGGDEPVAAETAISVASWFF